MSTQSEAEGDSKSSVGSFPHVLPRLPVFSGDDKDCQFDLWHFEVQCLEAEKRPEADIKLAIRRSLKGQAQRTLLALGIDAKLSEILTKFKTVFGPSHSIQTVLSTFYSLRQKEGEDAGSFSNRLQDCLHQAVQLGRVQRSSTEVMLKEAFEAGLRQQTRLAVSYLFGQPELTFDKLVLEVKRMERELGLDSSASVRSLQESQVKELTAQVAQLRTELQAIKQLHSTSSPSSNSGPARSRRGSQGQGYEPPSGAGPPPHPTAFYGDARAGGYRQDAQNLRRPPRQRGGPITCWRCGQEGHLARGCRNNVQVPLNSSQPVGSASPQAKPSQQWWGGRRW